MSSTENQDVSTPRASTEAGPPPESRPPENWHEALLLLVSSRIELVRVEAQEAAKAGSKKLVLVIATTLCMFFIWALLLAASIGVLAELTPWPWYGWTAVAACLHIIAALVMINLAKNPGETPFSATKAEFQKDREWIETLRKNQKSGN